MAYKPITDQQLRMYMSDLQKHSQRTSAARAGFSERSIVLPNDTGQKVGQTKSSWLQT